MFHLEQETEKMCDARHRKENARQGFNKRVIEANFVLASLKQRDQERLRRSFARRIIGIERLQARPGDFKLMQGSNRAIVWYEAGKIGGVINISDTYEGATDIPELTLTIVRNVNNALLSFYAVQL